LPRQGHDRTQIPRSDYLACKIETCSLWIVFGNKHCIHQHTQPLILSISELHAHSGLTNIHVVRIGLHEARAILDCVWNICTLLRKDFVAVQNFLTDCKILHRTKKHFSAQSNRNLCCPYLFCPYLFGAWTSSIMKVRCNQNSIGNSTDSAISNIALACHITQL
jgi:hypothetical protein